MTSRSDLALEPTPADWVEIVLKNFDEFLQDHASCEKKASGMALNIASHYPDKPALLTAMADLAVEELTHYREVIRLLTERGVTPGADRKDPYVRALNDLVRRGPEHYLMDRLLIAAIVEKRGHERFGLLANALARAPVQSPCARFYRAITASEDRHWQLFVQLARDHYDDPLISPRLMELVDAEGQLMRRQPLRPALH